MDCWVDRNAYFLPDDGKPRIFVYFSSFSIISSYVDFQKRFPGAVKKARVGFMSPLRSPRIKNPTYEQVCTGQSGHVEVLYVELNDPSKHFEELCRFFFTFHDPTLKNRQGNDAGFQYSSWIFCGDNEQFQIAQKVKRALQVAIDRKVITAYVNSGVQTQITDLSEFTEAHAAHQEYLFKNPNGYCNHRIRVTKWYELKEKY
jgi:peptide-methionine (S)-S-oxide reductase